MIRLEASKKKVGVCRSQGELDDLVAEVGMLMNILYSGLAKVNDGEAEQFRMAMVHAVCHPRSPVWEKDAIRGVFYVSRQKK